MSREGPSALARLAGIERLELRLDEQDRSARQHREWEGETLREIKTEVSETKELAQTTNGRVNVHEDRFNGIREREVSRIKLRQGITFTLIGAALSAVTLLGVHFLVG